MQIIDMESKATQLMKGRKEKRKEGRKEEKIREEWSSDIPFEGIPSMT
jgi:hypothetical protein